MKEILEMEKQKNEDMRIQKQRKANEKRLRNGSIKQMTDACKISVREKWRKKNGVVREEREVREGSEMK